MREEPHDREWLCRQADMLLERCPVTLLGAPFELPPEEFDKHPTLQERVTFLVRYFKLPYEDLRVFVHANMKEPGKVAFTTKLDTAAAKIGPGCELVSVKYGETYVIRDKSHADGPKKIEVKDK